MEYNLSSVEPFFVKKINEATFSLYKAKNFFEKDWLSPLLKEQVRKCRESFYRYGPVPEFDRHDELALIYIIKVEYEIPDPDGAIPIEEWLSMRFIPSGGKEENIEDLFITRIDGERASGIVEKYTKQKIRDVWNHVISISRLCGISPYTTKSSVSVKIASKKKYVAASFALMVQACMQECKKHKTTYHFFTARFRSDMLKKIMYHKKGEELLYIPFKTVQETLDLPKETCVTFDRGVWAHKCPGYHLDFHHMLDVIEDLIAKGLMSHDTITYHTKLNNNFSEIRKSSKSYVELVEKLSPAFGNMLEVDGPLYKSKLTGEQLRQHIDEAVADAPTLFLLPFDWWEKEIEVFLSKVCE
ncbi:MAG: hypothetical protein WCW16_04975 [Candidatus Magasanikbacteria bacterium]